MKADLHVHTNISDGPYDFERTITLAKARGVTHLAITNHDTVKGLIEAIVEGVKQGVTIIPGIEISACDLQSRKKVHLLGYNFDLKGLNIKKLCDPILERRNANSLWQLDSIIKAGIKIDARKVYERSKNSGVIYKQHIKAELVDENLYEKLFKGSGICAREIEYVDMIEAVKAITADNGIVVLAHPGQQDSFEFIPALVEAGLDGIELNHEDNSCKDRLKVMEYANKYNLILTGGSDFHGPYGTSINIGDIECPSEYHYIFENEQLMYKML